MAVYLADAWTALVADLEARKLSYQTIRKYKLLKSQMIAFGKDRGLSLLSQFDLDVLSKFRATWKDGPRTAGKKLERLRAFFRFCFDRQWVETNPAAKIKLPKVSICPTMPLSHEEMVEILTACDGLQITTPVEGKLNVTTAIRLAVFHFMNRGTTRGASLSEVERGTAKVFASRLAEVFAVVKNAQGEEHEPRTTARHAAAIRKGGHSCGRCCHAEPMGDSGAAQ
jgi:hypothetical protein